MNIFSYLRSSKLSMLIINRKINDLNYDHIFPRDIMPANEAIKTFTCKVKTNSKKVDFSGSLIRPAPNLVTEANLLINENNKKVYSGALFFIHLAYDIDILELFVKKIFDEQISPFTVHIILPSSLNEVLCDFNTVLNQLTELKEKYSFIQIISLPPTPAPEENIGAQFIPIIETTMGAEDWTSKNSIKNAYNV